MEVMYRGNNYREKCIYAERKGLCAALLILLIPILVLSTVGAFMEVAGAVVCGLIGTALTIGSSVLFFYIAAVDPGI